jgi:hypothetical protein
MKGEGGNGWSPQGDRSYPRISFVPVAVTKTASGWRYFHSAGKIQASSNPKDMGLQRMPGHLSAPASRNPDKVKCPNIRIKPER